LSVLVDESVAGGVSSDQLAGPARDDFNVVGCTLTEAAVWPVCVVVLDGYCCIGAISRRSMNVAG
jgi:hypothetical protein